MIFSQAEHKANIQSNIKIKRPCNNPIGTLCTIGTKVQTDLNKTDLITVCQIICLLKLIFLLKTLSNSNNVDRSVGAVGKVIHKSINTLNHLYCLLKLKCVKSG